MTLTDVLEERRRYEGFKESKEPGMGSVQTGTGETPPSAVYYQFCHSE